MRYSKKTMNRVRITMVKTITVLMLLMFILSICAADVWNPWLVFTAYLISGGWLFLVAYANGYVMDTKPWFERLKREGYDLH